jgi:flagellar basal body-associated protein FliL
MKKSYLVLAAVPAVCAAAGFGAGTFLNGKVEAKPQVAVQEPVKEKTEAEKVLDRIADEAPDHAPTKHQAPPAHAAPAHPAGNKKHREYEANLVPASAKGHGAAADPAKLQKASAKQMPQKVSGKNGPQTEKVAYAQHAHGGAEPTKSITGGAVDPRPKDAHVVQLGRMTVPVYKAKSVTYVVADFGVAVSNTEEASHYELAENSARLRDAILTTMHKVAGSNMLKGPSINSDELAEKMTSDLKKDFGGVEDVLLLSLYKTDIPRG